VLQFALLTPTSRGSNSITREPIGFPRYRDPAFSAWWPAPRHRVQSSRYETLEHTGYGVLAPQHDASNLRYFVVLLGQQNHLITRPALHIGCFFIPATQLGKGCCIYWGEGDWGCHTFLLLSDLPHAFFLLYHYPASFPWKHLADICQDQPPQR